MLKDIFVSAAVVLAGIHFLGGKYRRSIPAFITGTVFIIANPLLGIIFLEKSTAEYYNIMDFISNVLYVILVLALTQNVKITKRLWMLFLILFTFDTFYSLFVPYIPSQLFVGNILYIVMYSILIFVMLYVAKKSPLNVFPQVFSNIPKWIIASLLFFDFTCYFKEFGEYPNWYNIFYVASSILVFVSVLYFVFMIFKLQTQQTEILKQFEIQKEHSEKMLKSDDNLRRFRHDYKNHMIVVNSLLSKGETDRARDYINSIGSSINDSINKISTGNIISDAIINNKAVVAASSGSILKFSGQIPQAGIADEDLCIILANLIDNAIEYVKKLEEKNTININAAVQHGSFVFSISNPVITPVDISKTSKINKSEHGVGIKNVKRTVKKYGGDIQFNSVNNSFTVDIRMNLKTLI